MIEEQQILRSTLNNQVINFTLQALQQLLTFPAMLKGPALSNTARSQNQVGWIIEGPNAVYACTSIKSSAQKGLLPVCRVVVEIVHNTRLCNEVLSQQVTAQNYYQSAKGQH